MQLDRIAVLVKVFQMVFELARSPQHARLPNGPSYLDILNLFLQFRDFIVSRILSSSLPCLGQEKAMWSRSLLLRSLG